MYRYYEEVEPGDELGPVEKVAVHQGVVGFCDVWGNPGTNRFTDHETAVKDGLQGAIVPGIMSMAFLAQLLSQWAEGGSIKKLDVVFRQLVVHDQPVHLVGVVTEKNQTEGENQVECDVYLESLEGDRMVGGKATIVLPSRV